jgi:signal peptidase I
MEGSDLKNKEAEKTTGQSFWEILRFGLIALVIVAPIRWLIAEPFVVSGSSMVPTFQNGDYLIVDKISYKLGDPERNDVVIFKYPKDQTKFFVKRIIGLPGETVDIKGNLVTITNGEHKEGFELTEPYVKNISDNTLHVELGSDEYFVMGDNRSGSSDSRYWGAVNRNLLTGRALVRLLPLRKIDLLPGDYKQADSQ